MRKPDFIVGFVFLFLLAGAIFILTSGGDKAPITTFVDTNNRQISVPDNEVYSLVTFWATTCVGCQQEVPHLVDLQNDFGGKSLNIVAIAMQYDPPERVAIFQQKRRLNYAVVVDKDGGFAKAFGNVALTPTTFLIDKNGDVLYKKVGVFDERKVRKILTGS